MNKTHAGTLVFDISIVCVFACWAILLIGKGLGLSSSSAGYRLATCFGLVCLAIKLAFTKWNNHELPVCVLLVLIGLLTFISSGNASLFLAIIFIVALKDIQISTLARVALICLGVFLGMHVLLVMLGVFDAQSVVLQYGSAVRSRYALGYGSPNTAQYIMFAIIAAYVLWKGDSSNSIILILLGICSYLLYRFFTDSRTGFAMSLVLIALVCARRTRIVNAGISLCIPIFPLLGFASCLLCALVDGPPPVDSWGTLLSRFFTGNMIFESIDLMPFGTSIEEAHLATDQGYVYVLFEFGIIPWVLFLLASTIALVISVKKDCIADAGVLVCYALYTMMESYATAITLNISLLLLSKVIFPETSRRAVPSPMFPIFSDHS